MRRAFQFWVDTSGPNPVWSGEDNGGQIYFVDMLKKDELLGGFNASSANDLWAVGVVPPGSVIIPQDFYGPGAPASDLEGVAIPVGGLIPTFAISGVTYGQSRFFNLSTEYNAKENGDGPGLITNNAGVPIGREPGGGVLFFRSLLDEL